MARLKARLRKFFGVKTHWDIIEELYTAQFVKPIIWE